MVRKSFDWIGFWGLILNIIFTAIGEGLIIIASVMVGINITKQLPFFSGDVWIFIIGGVIARIIGELVKNLKRK